MTKRLRELLARFNGDAGRVSDYCRDYNIDLSKRERKYLEEDMDGA